MATVSGAVDLGATTQSNNADWSEEAFSLRAPGGAPIPLTGCVIRSQLRRTPEDPTVFLDLSSSPIRGITIEDDLDGTFLIGPPASMMRQIPAGDYVRDIVIQTPGGETLFSGRGAVTILQGVTRT